MPPPVLNSLGEASGVNQQVKEINSRVLEKAGDPPALHAYLQSQGIHYVFIGAKGGALSPRSLQDSNLFLPVYSAGGVWIFQLAP